MELMLIGREEKDGEENIHRLPRPREALTDLGNARRLVNLHGQDLKYVHDLKKWFVWDGQHWVADTMGEVERRAKEAVRLIAGEADDE